MTNLFKFNSLITPAIIKFMFYFGVVCSIIGALISIITGLNFRGHMSTAGGAGAGVGYALIFGGPIIAVVGIIIGRVFSEIILVLFMIRDELAWQRQQANDKL